MSNEVNNVNKNLVNNQVENLNAINNNGFENKQLINNDLVVEILQNQIEELKTRVSEEQEQRKYWEELYVKQNEEFKKLAFPPMLDTEEGNQQAEKEVKRSFWSRLFN